MREKLIELLHDSPYLDVLGGLSYWEEAADDLIAKGVKVQKWIPMTERLPEKTIDVLLYFGNKYKNQAIGFWHGCEECNAVYWCAYTDDGFYTDCDYKPTHWMPLPEAPKED